MKYVKLSPKKLSKWRKTSPYGPNAEQRRKMRRAHARYAKMFEAAVRDAQGSLLLYSGREHADPDFYNRADLKGPPVRPYDGQKWLDLFDGDKLKAEEAGNAGNNGAYL